MRGGLGTSEPSREGTDMKWCLSRAFLTHRWSRGTRGACVTSGTQSTLKKKWTQHRGTWLPATGPGFCPGSTLGAAPPPPSPSLASTHRRAFGALLAQGSLRGREERRGALARYTVIPWQLPLTPSLRLGLPPTHLTLLGDEAPRGLRGS